MDSISAQVILSNRLVKDTRAGYESKIKTIIMYFRTREQFQHLVHQSGELALPLPISAVESLFGFLATNTALPRRGRKKRRIDTASSVRNPNRRIGREDSDDDDNNDEYDNGGLDNGGEGDHDGVAAANRATISHSCMGGYKSALKSYYTERGKAFEDPDIPAGNMSLDQFCNDFVNSYEKTVADKQERGIMPINEGKSAIPFAGYSRLNKAFIDFKPPPTTGDTRATSHTRSGDSGTALRRAPRTSAVSWSTGLFGFANSTLQWNLLCRSETLDRVHLPHFDWANDSLKVTIIRTKKDLAGASQSKEKHVFANPLNPQLCPILALGLYVLTKDRNRRQNASGKFFEGAEQKHRYANNLRNIIATFPDSVIEIHYGCDRSDLGTHSHRKGGITFLLAIIDGPNPCAVYIRAGWSLGNTQDRYIMGGAGEDQLCGRILAGLPLDSEDFAVLPPHFSTEGLNQLTSIGLGSIIDGYDEYPQSFRRCVPYFLASVLYHLPTLHTWFPMDHPVWGAKLFASLSATRLEQLRSYVLIGRFSCPDTGLRCTGVPGLVMLQRNISALGESINLLEERISNSVTTSCNAIAEKVSTVPELLERMLLARFQIQGVVPLSVKDIRDAVAGCTTDLRDEMVAMRNMILSSAGLQNSAGTDTATIDDDAVECEGQLFYYCGSMHMVPERFVFPTCTPKNMWFRWHLGQQSQNIGPFRRLLDKYRCDIPPPQRPKVDKAAKVMRAIESIARDPAHNILASEVPVTAANCGAVFDAAYEHLLQQLYPAASLRPSFRINDLSYTTLYNRFPKVATT